MLGHDGAPPGFQVLVVEMRKNMETDFIYKEVFFAPWEEFLSVFCGRIW